MICIVRVYIVASDLPLCIQSHGDGTLETRSAGRWCIKGCYFAPTCGHEPVAYAICVIVEPSDDVRVIIDLYYGALVRACTGTGYIKRVNYAVACADEPMLPIVPVKI